MTSFRGTGIQLLEDRLRVAAKFAAVLLGIGPRGRRYRMSIQQGQCLFGVLPRKIFLAIGQVTIRQTSLPPKRVASLGAARATYVAPKSTRNLLKSIRLFPGTTAKMNLVVFLPSFNITIMHLAALSGPCPRS